MKGAATIAALLLAGCATTGTSDDPAGSFLARIQAHCGKAYEGRVVTDDPADSSFADQRLVMHVRQCSDGEVRIPFHVGTDRSRTWVVTRTAAGLRLKHDHRHEDGTSDALTMYGGDSRPPGSAERQEFPADAQSIAMFTSQGRQVSNSNVWALEARDGLFAYELRRPPIPGGRFFRVEFDLARPIDPPPAPWGG
ncbi:MAG TPA: hypothetical protein VFR36_08700 [Sphingomicrobium sp.]|nr:hypothetical protein [Sphingomicrobium sp.]